MNIIRYINGTRIECEGKELSVYEVGNETIARTIHAVNERMGLGRLELKKTVEIL